MNLNLNKDPSSWRRVLPDAVMAGSREQGENVLRMAIEDLLKLSDAYEEVTREQRQHAYIEAMQRDPKLD